MFQTCADDPSSFTFTAAMIVVELTTCRLVASGAAPWPPSKVIVAPLLNPVPVMVTLTFASACALFGVMVCIVTDGGVAVLLGVAVVVAAAVGETGVDVAGGDVGDGCCVDVDVTGGGVAETDVAVAVDNDVGDPSVAVVKGVFVGTADGVGVIKIGLPNSRHPRSGAAPANPVIGEGGIGSPFDATYCATPRSMAGEPA